MKILAIIIIGIAVLSISGIYIIQFTQNQQIDEILVTNESEGKCDVSIDTNRNGMPDIMEITEDGIEKDPVISLSAPDFSYCIFPNSMVNFIFKNTNLYRADFSNAELKNVVFISSNLNESNFSNSDLHGVVFARSSINESNFTNTDFYPNTWKNPYLMVHFSENKSSVSGEDLIFDSYSCYLNPCPLINIEGIENGGNYGMLSDGEHTYPNFRWMDKVNDLSDRREMYRHVTTFYESTLTQSTFKNVDLSYAVFHNTDMSNVVIESSNTSNVILENVLVYNTKINEKDYKKESMANGIFEDDNRKQMIYDKVNEKTQINDYKIDVNLINVMDDIPINWSMGMTTFEQNLYVADTDNHRIIVYDIDTLEKKSQFKSPISNYCKTTNTWSTTNPDCTSKMRNLPTSIAILNEKIFVSYGFQDDIQIFDLNGKFLSKFGNSGNKQGEFSGPMQISASNDLLYIADAGNKRIQVVDSEGQFIKKFTIPISDEADPQISLDISENKIFVINNKNADLFIYDLNGNLIKKIILEQDAGNSSIGVENGLIIVSNQDNHRVTIFDLDGVIMNEFGNYGEHYGEFKSPRGITVNDEKVYVSDPYNFRIQVFNIELN